MTTHDGDVTIESEVCENPGIVTFQHGRGVTVMFQICRYKELLTHNVWDRRKIITSLQLNIFCSKPIISRWQAIDYQVWEGEGATHTNLSPWCSECLPACDIYFILGCRWQIWAYIYSFLHCPMTVVDDGWSFICSPQPRQSLPRAGLGPRIWGSYLLFLRAWVWNMSLISRMPDDVDPVIQGL